MPGTGLPSKYGHLTSSRRVFAFDFRADASAVVMGVEVPPAYTHVLDAFTERVRAAVDGRP
ncbi:hypothetical protein [Nocardia asteroides]|uniref:Uncharacterized protein n=1 Tax=Nocardia asteroides NBRC 15531 TaxID=1110697 RepID=U5EKU9_NOCAS|nr:hypothetical protein [Nocardia asteroides]GAD86958.1 hypothetical protein NCAST_34_00850 [Nocardia asteroides NBRC 15531]